MCDMCACCHVPDHGACDRFEEGANGRCAYCDHSLACHPGTGQFFNLPLGVGVRGEEIMDDDGPENPFPNKMRGNLWYDSWEGYRVYCVHGHRWRTGQRMFMGPAFLKQPGIIWLSSLPEHMRRRLLEGKWR